jgi:hypothetical protein
MTPAARLELEAKLLEGLKTPLSDMTAQDWAALRQRILDRNSGLEDE